MIYQVGTEKEIIATKADIPTEVFDVAVDVCRNLDTYYGSDRDIYCDDGGFVLIATDKADVQALKNSHDVDMENDVFEYVEVISCVPNDYVNILYLRNNEYTVTVLLPKELASSNILNDLE